MSQSAHDQPDSDVLTFLLEILGMLAPSARVVVYLADASEAGLVFAVQAAVHDRERRADVVCLPWAFDELRLSPDAVSMFDGLLEEALALGLPVCAAAGKPDGAGLQPTFPGTHPLVLSCGATSAVLRDGELLEEASSSASRPASSALWPIEPWRAAAIGPSHAGVSHRPLPDVSALGTGDFGYRVHVGGSWTSFLTPAAAPALWAALIARMSEALAGPTGITSRLYPSLGPAGACTPITATQIAAGSAWDAAVGWGTPNGDSLLAALRGDTNPR